MVNSATREVVHYTNGREIGRMPITNSRSILIKSQKWRKKGQVMGIRRISGRKR